MTTNYAPAPLEDETLYSVIARYGRHTHALSPGDVAATILGDATAIAARELPNRLGPVCSWLGRSWTPRQASERLTLLPYYAAFHSEAERASIVARMVRDGGSVQLRLGVAAWRVRPPHKVRYCPTCCIEMMDRHGERYWRRSHQLPGVLVCPDHGDRLRDAMWPRVGRHGYVAATAVTCPLEPSVALARDGQVEAHLLGIARSSASLLKIGGGWEGTPEAYRSRLVLADLMRSAMKVDLARLSEAFRAFYGDALCQVGGVVGVDLSDLAWLVAMLRARRKAVHPLLHVLVDRFLAGTAEGSPPFGTGPWSCENPLADHRGEHTILVVDRRRDHGKVTGRFACRCGYAYTRRLCADGTVGSARLARYGPTLEPVLRELAKPGASLRGVAKRVGLDAKTMLREARALGLDLPWAGKQVDASTGTRSVVATPCERSTARSRKPRVARPRVDWPALDAELTDRIRAACADVTAAEPPRRLTLAAVERRVGRPGWLRKRRTELPMANAEIDFVSETTHAFRVRRVRYAARRLGGKGAAVWEVLRSAGVPARYGMLAQEALTPPPV